MERTRPQPIITSLYTAKSEPSPPVSASIRDKGDTSRMARFIYCMFDTILQAQLHNCDSFMNSTIQNGQSKYFVMYVEVSSIPVNWKRD